MKEFVTMLCLMGVGLWVVHDATPWMYRMAILSGKSDDMLPDPRFVGFDAGGAITRIEMRRYRAIYGNTCWDEQKLAQRDLAKNQTVWQ